MLEQKYFSCPRCARGCGLDVVVEGSMVTVTGNACSRGEEFGRQEAVRPMRPLETTVPAAGGIRPLLRVRGNAEIPLDRLLEAMAFLDTLTVAAPIESGQVLVKDLLGLDIDLVAREALPTSQVGPRP